MTPEQIEIAVGFHLGSMAGAPTIVRSNQDANPARPFISFTHHPVSRMRPGIAGGGAVVESGYFALSLVIARNQFATPANNLAALITARFPKGLPLTVGAGSIVISEDARISGPGYVDMQDWRLPMRIDYRAIA